MNKKRELIEINKEEAAELPTLLQGGTALDAAVWGAELAVGDGPGHIYCVEPTGTFENDPNLTDKKFPGNPTRSYRTQYSLRVVGEVLEWEGHSPETLQKMQNYLEELKRLGIEAIND